MNHAPEDGGERPVDEAQRLKQTVAAVLLPERHKSAKERNQATGKAPRKRGSTGHRPVGLRVVLARLHRNIAHARQHNEHDETASDATAAEQEGTALGLTTLEKVPSSLDAGENTSTKATANTQIVNDSTCLQSTPTHRSSKTFHETCFRLMHQRQRVVRMERAHVCLRLAGNTSHVASINEHCRISTHSA